jgi:hypothetical protein
MGYSSVKLYKDMVKALRPAKTIRTKVTPVSSAPATGWQAADRVTKKALELYLQSQKEEKEKQDISARMQMFRDYNKPQAEFDPSKYGQTPDQLRDTGYKTVNYATTGEGDFGGDNVYDGDEPLSRDPEEAKAWQTLYEEEAKNTQNLFNKENPYGMDLVNSKNYNSVDTNSSLDRFFGMEKDKVEGPQTSEMRMALMGDSIGRKEAETERLRVIDAAAKLRNQTLGDAERNYGRKRLTAKNLAVVRAEAASQLTDDKIKINKLKPEMETSKVKQANALFVARRALKNAILSGTPEEIETAKAVVDSLEFTIRGQDPDSVGKRQAAKMAPSLTQKGKAAWATFDSKAAPLLAMSANVDKILYGDGTEEGRAKAKSGLEYRTGYSSFIPAAAQFSEDARATQAQLMTLGSKIKQNVLQAYREMGQTGGAVGQVSNQEQEMFLNNLAAMEQSQSYEDFVKNMETIKFFVEGNPNGTEFEKKGTIARIRESMELEHGLKSRYLPAPNKNKSNLNTLLKIYGG